MFEENSEGAPQLTKNKRALKEENNTSAKTTTQQFLALSPEHSLPNCTITLHPTAQLLVCKLPIPTLEPENYSTSDGVSEYPE